MILFWSDKRDEYSAAIMDSSSSLSALIAVYAAFSSSSGSAVQVSSCVLEGSNIWVAPGIQAYFFSIFTISCACRCNK